MGQKRKRIEEVGSEQNDIGSVESERTSEKRTKRASTEPRSPQPLTERNLALLQSNMGQSKGTSKKAGKQPASEEQTGGSDSTIPKHLTPDRLRRSFRHQGLHMKDSEALARHENIMSKASAMVKSKRNSQMSEEEKHEFAKQRDKHELRPEADFVETMWHILIPLTRTVRETAQDDSESDRRMLKEWSKSGLDLTRRLEFMRGCVPLLDTRGDPILQQLVKALPRVKNPAPDHAYGLEESLFTKEEQNIMDANENVTRLSKYFYHTFFAVEFKGCQGTIFDAEFQACRSGAAITNAMRQFKTQAEILDTKHQYDDGSIAFTLALTPTEARMFVHWAERLVSGQVIFHMNKVEQYAITDGKDAPQLRQHINNVLDWGVSARLAYIKDQLKLIKARINREYSLREISMQREEALNGPVPSEAEDGSDSEDEHASA